MKRILSLILVTVLLTVSLSTQAFATEEGNNKIYSQDTGITDGISELTLEIIKSEDILIATVPLQIPIVTDTRNNTVYPDNLVIKNETEDKDIEVTYVAYNFTDSDIHLVDAWVDDFLADPSIETWGEQKVMALDIFGCVLGRSGPATANEEDIIWCRDAIGYNESRFIISAGESRDIEFKVAVGESIYSVVTSEQIIGTLTFTLAIVE